MRDTKTLAIDAASWEGRAADVEKYHESTPQDRGRETEDKQKTSGYAERSAATPADQRPHIDATFLVESASPASVSSATDDAAPTEQIARQRAHIFTHFTDSVAYIKIILRKNT